MQAGPFAASVAREKSHGGRFVDKLAALAPSGCARKRARFSVDGVAGRSSPAGGAITAASTVATTAVPRDAARPTRTIRRATKDATTTRIGSERIDSANVAV